jgi:hypothetical protein
MTALFSSSSTRGSASLVSLTLPQDSDILLIKSQEKRERYIKKGGESMFFILIE